MIPTTKRVWLTIIGVAAIFFLGFFLSEVFSGHLILPQDFHLGPLAIHYYGLIMALATAAGFYLALKRAPQYRIDLKVAEDLLFWIIVGGFIGARLYHVLSSASYYWQNPVDILKVWNGGLSIYGAILGGILTLWLYKRLKTIDYRLTTALDWLVPSVLLGQIIGRFGNLFNYEAFGYPTSLPWKMFVPEMFRPIQYASSAFFHPWFLYEAFGNVIILFFLLKVLKPRVSGELVFTYILLYNCLRFALEFLRIDSTFIGSVRLNAASSFLLVIIALVGLLYVRKYPKTP